MSSLNFPRKKRCYETGKLPPQRLPSFAAHLNRSRMLEAEEVVAIVGAVTPIATAMAATTGEHHQVAHLTVKLATFLEMEMEMAACPPMILGCNSKLRHSCIMTCMPPTRFFRLRRIVCDSSFIHSLKFTCRHKHIPKAEIRPTTADHRVEVQREVLHISKQRSKIEQLPLTKGPLQRPFNLLISSISSFLYTTTILLLSVTKPPVPIRLRHP